MLLFPKSLRSLAAVGVVAALVSPRVVQARPQGGHGGHSSGGGGHMSVPQGGHTNNSHTPNSHASNGQQSHTPKTASTQSKQTSGNQTATAKQGQKGQNGTARSNGNNATNGSKTVSDPGPPPSPVLTATDQKGSLVTVPNPAFTQWQVKENQFLASKAQQTQTGKGTGGKGQASKGGATGTASKGGGKGNKAATTTVPDPGPPPSPVITATDQTGKLVTVPNPAFTQWQVKENQFLASKAQQTQTGKGTGGKGQPAKGGATGTADKTGGKGAGTSTTATDPGPPPSPVIVSTDQSGKPVVVPNPAFTQWQVKENAFLAAQAQQKSQGQGSSTTNPGTTNPGTTNPGTTNPGTPSGGTATTTTTDGTATTASTGGSGGFFSSVFAGGGLPFGFGGFGGGGFGGGVAPAVVDDSPIAAAPAPAPTATQAPVDNSLVPFGTGTPDLIAEDIQPFSPATVLAGPAYQVTFRNQGTAAAGPFRVALYATIDGKPSEDAKVVVDVPGLIAGQMDVVTLRLPASAMKMVSATTGKTSAANGLMVAVDPDNRVVEKDKSNNTALVDLSAVENR